MRLLFPFLIILSLLLISCSGGQGSDKVISEEITIRALAEHRENELLWTRELESVRLLLDTKKNQVVADSIKLEPLVMTSALTGKKSLYPYLEGFGSLDTSSISKEMKTFLDSTFESLAKWQLSSLKVQDNSIFSLTLFKYDIEHLWEENFSETFPIVQDDITLFQSKLYGEPYFLEDQVQLPVRLYALKGHIDIILYFTSITPYKIDAIQISRWERK
ncbi:MAG: hypothetical protein K6F15_00340 [Treponema sp.]|nr:hypothetical protein [Treponema sp.]